MAIHSKGYMGFACQSLSQGSVASVPVSGIEHKHILCFCIFN